MSNDPNWATEAEPPGSARQGVRDRILADLEREDRQRGTWAAKRLAVAGAAGVSAAIALLLLFGESPSEANDHSHLALCGAAWAGLLAISFAFVLMRVRTPRLPLAHAAALALVGLVLAALMGLCCPEPHFLAWWESTSLGRTCRMSLGAAGSALCFGFVSTLLIAFGAALSSSWRGTSRPGTLLAALALWLLLVPAVLLQTLAISIGVFAAWATGAAAGSYLGVASGKALSP